MPRSNILVVVQVDPFSGVHHALALARRMVARVYVLRIESPPPPSAAGGTAEKILHDAIASALESGLDVAYHTAPKLAASDLRQFVNTENISLLIVGEEGPQLKALLSDSRLGVPPDRCRLIEVKAKDATSQNPKEL